MSEWRSDAVLELRSGLFLPKRLAKSVLNAVSLLIALAPASLTGFGRWEAVYTIFAHLYALTPGVVGDYLRIAFYRLTLAECAISSRISFGSFFAHPDARVRPGVYIGSHCIIGKTSIGERTQIASGVQILSGGRQHFRSGTGEMSGSEYGNFTVVTIGADCWIGAGAIVMADVERGSTIGAGSVVTRPIPACSIAVGSPARVVKTVES
jgi:acetyltransferase-like isoleucine patch superfamily enzyme